MKVFLGLRHLSIKKDESDRTHIISYICFFCSQLFDSSKLLCGAWTGVHLFSFLLSHLCHSHFSHCPPLPLLSVPLCLPQCTSHIPLFFLVGFFFLAHFILQERGNLNFRTWNINIHIFILLLLGFLLKAIIICLKPLEMCFQKPNTYGGRDYF